MGRDLSAMEVDAMNDKKYKWFVFDMLQKGDKKMEEQCRKTTDIKNGVEELKVEVLDLKEKFENHCIETDEAFIEHLNDRQAHPFGITLKEKVVNKQNGILGVIITIAGGVVWYIFDKLFI